MENAQNIADQIRKIAKQRKKSVKQVLIDCGVGPNTVTKLSNGTDILTTTLCKIADYFNCSTDFLLGREEKGSLSMLTENEQRILALFKQLDLIQQENVIARAELLAEQNDAEYITKENVS